MSCSNGDAHLRSSSPNESWETAKFRDKQPFEVRILGNNLAQSEAAERAICFHVARVARLTRLVRGSGRGDDAGGGTSVYVMTACCLNNASIVACREHWDDGIAMHALQPSGGVDP